MITRLDVSYKGLSIKYTGEAPFKNKDTLPCIISSRLLKYTLNFYVFSRIQTSPDPVLQEKSQCCITDHFQLHPYSVTLRLFLLNFYYHQYPDRPVLPYLLYHQTQYDLLTYHLLYRCFLLTYILL